MPGDHNTSHNETSPGSQGSILRGILGSVIGMLVCILVMLLCALCRIGDLITTFQLFVGLVIGWSYRLFRGRRSKTAAYVTVGICTVSASVLWVVLLALLSVFAAPDPSAAVDWGRLWGKIWEPVVLCRTQPLCAGDPDHRGGQQPPVAETVPRRPGVFCP